MAKRKIVCIDEEKCNGCGQCVHACAGGAIELSGSKARLVAEKYCDGLAACLGTCPQDAISIIERDAESFDPKEVERYLAGKNKDQINQCAGDATKDGSAERPASSTRLFQYYFLLLCINLNNTHLPLDRQPFSWVKLQIL